MGAGIQVLRTLMVALASALAASCIDFVAPDLPELGAPAVFDANLRVHDNGRVDFEGRLAPGLTEDGLRRRVVRDSVRVLGRTLPPMFGGLVGRRSYIDAWATTAETVAGTLTIDAPVIADVGPPPSLSWPGIRRLDEMTVRLGPGEDLVLHVTSPQNETPQPLHRSWLLRLEGFESSFVIGAGGAPPAELRVERRWLPAPADGIVRGVLIYSRSVSVRAENATYIGVLLVESRVTWTIMPEPEPMPARRGGGGG